jgi:hypothetical protein
MSKGPLETNNNIEFKETVFSETVSEKTASEKDTGDVNSESEQLEQELNEFLLTKLETLIPFINQCITEQKQVTIEDFKDKLQISSKVKTCSYVFRRGVKSNSICNNICLDSEKDVCNKCSKRLNKDYRTIKLFPSVDNPDIFSDDQGCRYRKNQDQTLEVLDRNLLDEKKKEKLKKNGIKI